MGFESITGKIKNPDFENLLGDCPGERKDPLGVMKYQIVAEDYVITINEFPAGRNIYTLEVSSYKTEDSAEKIMGIVKDKLSMEEIDNKKKELIILARPFYE